LAGILCSSERVDIVDADEHAIACSVVREACAVEAWLDGPTVDMEGLAVLQDDVAGHRLWTPSDISSIPVECAGASDDGEVPMDPTRLGGLRESFVVFAHDEWSPAVRYVVGGDQAPHLAGLCSDRLAVVGVRRRNDSRQPGDRQERRRRMPRMIEMPPRCTPSVGEAATCDYCDGGGGSSITT